MFVHRNKISARFARSGISVIEVLLAIAIFGVLAASLMILVWEPLVSSSSAAQRVQAVLLAEEGLDAARSIRNADWLALIDGDHGIDITGGTWVFSGTSDTDGTYIRVVTVEPVSRDVSGDITDTGGTLDARTKKVTSTVSWDSPFGGDKSLSFSTFFTNWNVIDWTQETDTDFAGGINNGTIVTGFGDAAYIELGAGGGSGTWDVWTSSSVTHTTDGDFSAGTPTDVTVTGDGIELSSGGIGSWSDYGLGPVSGSLYGIDMVSSSDGWVCGAGGAMISWDGSSWSGSESVAGTNTYAVDMVSSTNGHAAGEWSLLYSYNGSSWSYEGFDVLQNITAIGMVDGSDGWAGSSGGRVLRWDGADWNFFTDIGAEEVGDIYMLSTSDGWLVAQNGRIERWDGSSWSAFTSPTSSYLRAIDMIDANDGWVVGDSGTIIRWNGSSWSSVSSPTSDDLYGISVVASDDVWAVGESGRIIHWDGSSWSSVSSPTSENLYDIAMVSNADGWAVGANGTILRFELSYASPGILESSVINSGKTGTSWSQVSWTESLPAGTDVTVAFRSGDTATPDGSWSSWGSEVTNETGSAVTSSSSQYLQYRVTMTTSSIDTPRLEDITVTYDEVTSSDLYGVGGSAVDDVWTVGESGTLLNYDGSSWSSFSSPTGNDINAVDVLAFNDAWAAADSEQFLNWDGSAWTIVSDIGSGTLNDIDLITSSSGWAVGSGEEFFEYDGSSWSELFDLGEDTPQAVFMLSAVEGWAAGSSEKFYRYDGLSWADFSDLGGETIYDIYMISSSEGWAVGSGGKFYRWNGTAWFEYVDVGGATLYGVIMISAVEGWAVGSGGALYEWDGNSWSSVVSGVTEDLYDVSIVSTSPTIAWAVGANGTLLSLTAGGSGTSGTYESSILDTDSTDSIWETMYFDVVLPNDSTATVALRSGDTPTPDGSWASWSSEISVTSGTAVPVSGARYLQYRVTLEKNTSPDSPEFHGITITYTQ